MDKNELISYIQRVIDEKYNGLQALFAESNDISPAYVNDVLRGRKDPGGKILAAIGFEKVTTYKQKNAIAARIER